MSIDVKALRERFAARFGGHATVHRAPGRVNLIGEHTDYNDGYVMPVAIDRATHVAIGPRRDRRLVVRSETAGSTVEADIDDLPRGGGWPAYVFGVAAMLRRHGVSIDGANLLIESDVPLAAGLSSSAALEVAVAYALAGLAGRHVDAREIARICQQAENDYVGARCGIMDQFVAVHGQAGHALFLDCRSLDYRAIPIPASLRLVVCNTMVRHSIAAGQYNARRQECEEAVRALTTRLPHVRALRDVMPGDLNAHDDLLTAAQRLRTRHVVGENARVVAMTRALESGDLDAMGRLMNESHESLRDDFQVSCRELNLLVTLAACSARAVGARMTGGGFGGCTVNLVDADAVDEFSSVIAERYAHETTVHPEIYVCNAADGAGIASRV
jgi:galactokinase